MLSDVDIHHIPARTTPIGVGLSSLALVLLIPYGEPWRLVPIGLVCALMIGAEAVRRRGRGVSWRWLSTGIALGQTLMVFATGGLESPLAVILVPLSVIVGYTHGAQSLRLVWHMVLAVALLFAFEQSPWRPDGFVPAVLGGERPVVGQVIWAALLVFSIGMGNRIARVARASLDAEQRRVGHAQRVAMDAMDRQRGDLVALSGAIAHALKNPLTAVMSIASYHHRRAPDPSDRRAELEVMLGEMDRMRSQLADLLNLSRPADALEPEPVAFAALVTEVLTAHGALAAEAGVTLAAPVGDARAHGDRRKLQQVLGNLVQNAVQAGRPGGRIEIVLSQGDGEARVEVRDDGPGVPAALARRIFEPGVTGRREGTGIGLTICRTLVEQHGGRIWMQPSDAGGTRMVFAVPVTGPPSAVEHRRDDANEGGA